jgi:AcrR family transcriptional regulator
MPYPKRVNTETVVERALELVRQGGPQALSMRVLAASLEVQASSLYRYFPNRQALEGALSERAASHLEDRMRRVAGNRDAAEAFRAIAKEYLRFAREEHALFELLLAPHDQSEPRPAGKSLWNFLLEIVGAITGRRDDTSSAVVVWAFLHGFAVLERSGNFGASGPRRGFTAGVDALLKGLA